MPAPDQGLTIGEWLTVGAASLIAGIGGAMSWFNGTKKDLIQRMNELESKQEDITMLHNDHQTQLAVVKSCQENTRMTLDELKETARDVNQKLDQVLLGLQRRD